MKPVAMYHHRGRSREGLNSVLVIGAVVHAGRAARGGLGYGKEDGFHSRPLSDEEERALCRRSLPPFPRPFSRFFSSLLPRLILEFRHSAPLIMQALFSTHLTERPRRARLVLSRAIPADALFFENVARFVARVRPLSRVEIFRRR